MNIIEIIKELQQIHDKHGNLTCVIGLNYFATKTIYVSMVNNIADGKLVFISDTDDVDKEQED